MQGLDSRGRASRPDQAESPVAARPDEFQYHLRPAECDGPETLVQDQNPWFCASTLPLRWFLERLAGAAAQPARSDIIIEPLLSRTVGPPYPPSRRPSVTLALLYVFGSDDLRLRPLRAQTYNALRLESGARVLDRRTCGSHRI